MVPGSPVPSLPTDHVAAHCAAPIAKTSICIRTRTPPIARHCHRVDARKATRTHALGRIECSPTHQYSLSPWLHAPLLEPNIHPEHPPNCRLPWLVRRGVMRPIGDALLFLLFADLLSPFWDPRSSFTSDDLYHSTDQRCFLPSGHPPTGRST